MYGVDSLLCEGSVQVDVDWHVHDKSGGGQQLVTESRCPCSKSGEDSVVVVC